MRYREPLFLYLVVLSLGHRNLPSEGYKATDQCPRCLRHEHWDHGFQFRSRHGCMSTFSRVCVVLCRWRLFEGPIFRPRKLAECVTRIHSFITLILNWNRPEGLLHKGRKRERLHRHWYVLSYSYIDPIVHFIFLLFQVGPHLDFSL
jgi:hypothetical protein